MKNETSLQNLALSASFVLHGQLLADCNYAGYDGGKNDFDNLYKEVYSIIREELPNDADLEQIVDCFHEYQLEIMNGQRDVCWFL
jgi:hypothetical protein